MNATIKLVLIVRDPIVRVISDYVHNLDIRRKKNPNLTFEGLALTSSGDVDIGHKDIYESIYGLHFADWLKVRTSF